MKRKKNNSRFESYITENFQVEYWAEKFAVRPALLREVMKLTGNEVDAVQKYFNK